VDYSRKYSRLSLNGKERKQRIKSKNIPAEKILNAEFESVI
jgi:hypothetical protein